MSYILDALKRADAERERGAVPGLHSQRSTPTPTPAPRRNPRPHWLALGLCAILLLGALWWWLKPTPSTAPTQGPTLVPTPPQPTQQADVAVQPPASTPPPVVVAPAPPLLRPLPPKLDTPTAVETPTSQIAAARNTASATARGQSAESSDANVRRFAELTPDQRAQLPQLNVNGASYSANPAHRMLIINGAVVQEGGEVAPGLVLERIGLNQAVLRQGGLRFSIVY